MLWETPFDPADPVGTPRNLARDQPARSCRRCRTRWPSSRAKGVAPDTPWGSLQVAGDDGAPAIPIGGGEGFAGNANAVASRDPASNLKRLYPISYGSSHIQAIAFKAARPAVGAHDPDLRRVDGPDAEDVSRDQTRLFSRERWVRFPWTDAQIRHDAVRTYVVRGRWSAPDRPAGRPAHAPGGPGPVGGSAELRRGAG